MSDRKRRRKIRKQIRKSWNANHKYQEAVFFFRWMNQSQDGMEFTFFLSAFLSATTAALEGKALKSDKPEFAEWYRQISPTILGEPFELIRLLRNAEAHDGGSPAYRRMGFSLGEEGITIHGDRGQTFEAEFSPERKEVRVRVNENAQEGEWQSVPTTQTWIWDAEGEPDVMKTCEAALQALRTIINDWKNRGFGEDNSS